MAFQVFILLNANYALDFFIYLSVCENVAQYQLQDQFIKDIIMKQWDIDWLFFKMVKIDSFVETLDRPMMTRMSWFPCSYCLFVYSRVFYNLGGAKVQQTVCP